jgi:hypothetical protein
VADHSKSASHGGTPEYVAFLLMEKISDLEKMKRAVERKEMLDLYAECLLAAHGKRTPRAQS